MKSYTGYVVGKEETNPISVWIPAKSGYIRFGAERGFGSNVNNMTLNDLALIRMNAEKCYITTEINPNGPYNYDDTNGFSTIEENIPYLDRTTAKNLTVENNAPNLYSSPGNGEFIHSPHTSPAVNWLQTYYPQQAEGAEINTFENAPAGNFSTLSIGTKVLVIYPDNKGIGYIIRQIPYSDEMSKVIKDLSGS
jgi:hypothetical protein